MRRTISKRPIEIVLDYGLVDLAGRGTSVVDSWLSAQIGRFNWYLSNSGYAISTTKNEIGKSKTLYLHRLVLERNGICVASGFEVDHINRDKLDNRFCNLRLVTRQGNNRNRASWAVSRVKGVDFWRNRWRARIWNGVKNQHIGMFDTQQDAIDAYANAEKLRSD